MGNWDKVLSRMAAHVGLRRKALLSDLYSLETTVVITDTVSDDLTECSYALNMANEDARKRSVSFSNSK